MSRSHPKPNTTLWLTRVKRGIPRKRLASRLGLRDASTVYRWEKGSVLPSLENALRLGSLLSMPVDFLFKELREELLEKANLDLADERTVPRGDGMLAAATTRSGRYESMRSDD